MYVQTGVILLLAIYNTFYKQVVDNFLFVTSESKCGYYNYAPFKSGLNEQKHWFYIKYITYDHFDEPYMYQLGHTKLVDSRLA